jgi:Zn-dependent M28 family amino/carboxypeptidase
MVTTTRRISRAAISALAVGLVLLLLPAADNRADAAPGPRPKCEREVNDTLEELLACADVAGAREHQAALQKIADKNDDTRASGTSGYERSVRYVVKRLQRAGYDPEVQAFPFAFYEELSDPTMEQVSPDPTVYVHEEDFLTMTYSGSGDVTATVQAVDINIADPSVITSGCEAEDFADFVPGNIALIQRGTCFFEDKVVNAVAAGAAGVIIFNQGNTPERSGVLAGTLGQPFDIPVVGTSFAIGADLADPEGTVVHLVTDTVSEIRQTWNVHAETNSGDDTNVVQVGAHLDSVIEGPGIQDNGSGSAAILEVAEAMSQVDPVNTVRFSWWGAEELGLLGSTYYVENLSAEEAENIALYLNFDMVGSPNYVRFVYDGDGSAFGIPGPEGSADIEAVFAGFYESIGLESAETPFNGRSDYGPFIAIGIPAGGLFTGAEGIKTAEEAAIYGGTAGIAYDPCYHQACDTYDNVSEEVLDVNVDAIAYATLTYAMTAGAIP